MKRIDEIHTAHPTWGYRTITKIIRRDEKIIVNRKKIRRLMQVMGVYTIYPKPNLSKRYHAQYVRPYLLRNQAEPKQKVSRPICQALPAKKPAYYWPQSSLGH